MVWEAALDYRERRDLTDFPEVRGQLVQQVLAEPWDLLVRSELVVLQGLREMRATRALPESSDLMALLVLVAVQAPKVSSGQLVQ